MTYLALFSAAMSWALSLISLVQVLYISRSRLRSFISLFDFFSWLFKSLIVS
jgi:hypothetical protein